MKNQDNQFENYLDRIEAIEKKERKKKITLGLLGVALILLMGAGAWFWQSGTNNLVTYGYKELDTESVRELIADGAVPLLSRRLVLFAARQRRAARDLDPRLRRLARTLGDEP
ncbi:MAG: hypothetical protein AAGM67_16100, partial [Bacteroidota bacterium]